MVRRLDRIAEELDRQGADALWVHPSFGFTYLTGLQPLALERPTALVILAGGGLRALAPLMLAPELEEIGAAEVRRLQRRARIYVPDRFGVRYENLVHLGPDGPELLNAGPRTHALAK